MKKISAFVVKLVDIKDLQSMPSWSANTFLAEGIIK